MFFNDSGKPILQAILDRILQQQLEKQWEKDAVVTKEALLPNDVVVSIIQQATSILRNEANVVKVDAPVNIVGDIHGQFMDLLYLFELCGPLTQTSETDSCSPETSIRCAGSPVSPRSPKPESSDDNLTPSTTPTTASRTFSRTKGPVSPLAPLSPASRKSGKPHILRKRSEEHLDFTYGRRRSVWATSDEVKKCLTSKDEKESTNGSRSGGDTTPSSTETSPPDSTSSSESFNSSPLMMPESCPAIPEEMPVYLFMGDYVDRGNFGCECMIYLLSLKVVFPDNIFLLRGNHETRCMTKRHFDDGTNFEAECVAKYGQQMFELFMSCFDCLPLTGLVETGEKPFLAMHGGISKKIKTLDDVMAIDRFCEPPLKGAMCDLLWSDPINEKIAERFNDSDYQEFLEFDYLPNPVRGCSSYYCYGAVQEFLNANNFAGIFRAHECKEEGISFTFAKTRSESFEFPLVTTVFSAPNYCGTYHNRGAVVRVTRSDIGILRFSAASANPLQPAGDRGESTTGGVSVLSFNDISISESNSEKFEKAVKKDLSSELHPGWQSLRKVTRIVTLLSKYRRAASMSGTALLDFAAAAAATSAASRATEQQRASTSSAQGRGLRRTATFSDSSIDSSNGSVAAAAAAAANRPVTQQAKAAVFRAQRRATVGEDHAAHASANAHQSPLSHREAGLALFGRKFMSVVDPSAATIANAAAASEEEAQLQSCISEEGDGEQTEEAEEMMLRSPSTKSVISSQVSEEDNEQLRILFDAIDQDGNGSISPSELEQFGMELGCEAHVIAHVRDLMDQNHDGVISYDEFVEYAGELLYNADQPPA